MKDPINDDNKYQVGEVVFAKEHPNEALSVRRYTRRIYYCTDANHPKNKDLVYYDRELV